jgi:signal transduction histidine kinase
VKVFRSLRVQLAAAILTVLALGLGLLLIMAGSQISRMTMEAFTHEQQAQALALANSFPEAFERRSAQQLLQSWISRRNLLENEFSSDTNINVFTSAGALVASNASGGRLAVDSDRVVRGSVVSTIIDGRLYTAVPIIHEGRSVLGTLQIDTDVAPVQARLFGRWLALIGAAAGALVLAFVIAMWVAAQLTRPLSQLRGVAQQMAEGRLDARVAIDDTVNELAAVGSMFNHMAARIEQTVQEQRDFVANASHELRAPLAAIKIRAEALASQSIAGPRAQQYAAEINDDVGQLASLVGDLLQLSRAESGAFTPPTEPIDVLDELHSCARAVAPRVAQRQQQLEIQLDDAIPELYIQPTDLALMVGNLLDNAIKYTPEGGRISLEATWHADTLTIAVNDTGVGIPPADLPRISERFFRVDRAHTRDVPGVGLGLALVSAVARQYGGTLRVTSSGVPGEGTQASLELPAPASSRLAPSRALASAQPASLR